MISIIIPTYNEGSVIVNCLESLLKQNYKNFEVIVVDDGSVDETVKKLQKLQISNLKILSQKHRGAGAARNLGGQYAKGDIFVFIDADMTFGKDFLKNLVNPIIEGKSKGTFSKDEYVANWENVWARCWNIQEGWENKKRHPKNYPNTQPVFRAILKSEFEKVGGFTAGGYNDDWSLSKKLGYEATIAENSIFFHRNPDSLKEIFLHAKWVGKREYKLGFLGYIVALIRSSIPISIILGILYSLIHLLPAYLIFKIVYDFGIFVGIWQYAITGKGGK